MTDWIEHKGDGIPTLKLVDVRYRSGDVAENVTPDPNYAIWNWRDDPHPHEFDIVAYRVRGEKKESAMREFETGATRNLDNGKLDYEGFLSPLVMERFAEYM